jgi:hypothetical protein
MKGTLSGKVKIMRGSSPCKVKVLRGSSGYVSLRSRDCNPGEVKIIGGGSHPM